VLQSPKPLTEISFEESDLLQNIRELEDPRTRWTQHSLINIVTIAIMAVLSGADDWNAVQAYGEVKRAKKVYTWLVHGLALIIFC
jgi:DDE_Tnp_1-associated